MKNFQDKLQLETSLSIYWCKSSEKKMGDSVSPEYSASLEKNTIYAKWLDIGACNQRKLECIFPEMLQFLGKSISCKQFFEHL